MEFGGNKFLLWLGNILVSRGSKLIKKGKKIIITNPKCYLINTVTLMTTFKIDGDAYQLITEGEYKNIYKENKTEPLSLSEDEMMVIITSNRKKWFLKR